MSDPEGPLNELRRQMTRLGTDLREMLGLRWQLALLELQADFRSAKRLAVALAIALVVGLTALPLLTAAAADALDGWLGIRRALWLLIFGSVMLSAAAIGGWLAWRRFLRRLVGLEATLEELHEDAAWLREWTGPAERDDGPTTKNQ